MSRINLGRAATVLNGVSVAVTAAGSTKTAQLKNHVVHLITASSPTHVRMGPTGDTATTSDFLLGTGQILEVEPCAGFDFLHGISPAAGSGVLYAAQAQIDV